MDPDEALRQLLELARKVRHQLSAEMFDSHAVDMQLVDEAVQVCEQVEELNVWLTAGGFLPAAWVTSITSQDGRKQVTG